MAAIDPTAEPEGDASPPRATLKLIRRPFSEMLEDDDEDSEDEEMAALLNGNADSDSSDEDDDEEVNGGPSDPSKSKRARREAAAKEALEALKNEESDDRELDGITQAGKKGKGKSKLLDEDDVDESESSVDPREVETFVICTLDPVQVGSCPDGSDTADCI